MKYDDMLIPYKKTKSYVVRVVIESEHYIYVDAVSEEDAEVQAYEEARNNIRADDILSQSCFAEVDYED